MKKAILFLDKDDGDFAVLTKHITDKEEQLLRELHLEYHSPGPINKEKVVKELRDWQLIDNKRIELIAESTLLFQFC